MHHRDSHPLDPHGPHGLPSLHAPHVLHGPHDPRGPHGEGRFRRLRRLRRRQSHQRLASVDRLPATPARDRPAGGDVCDRPAGPPAPAGLAGPNHRDRRDRHDRRQAAASSRRSAPSAGPLDGSRRRRRRPIALAVAALGAGALVCAAVSAGGRSIDHLGSRRPETPGAQRNAKEAGASRPGGNRTSAGGPGARRSGAGNRGASRPLAVGSGPTVKSAYAGFTDLNGNGVLDCGEPVDLIATFATNNSGTPALSGSLFAPVDGSAGLTFLHGSVVIDPVLTNGCSGIVLTGNGPSDSDLRVDFACPADPIDNDAWTLVVRYRATYSGTASPPGFSAGATANTSDGATYHDVATAAAGSACTGGGGGGGGGATTAIALTKTAAGPATPGSLLVYTLTATDQSGAGDGGLTLLETVPQHTTFSASGSSPGWSCSAPASPAGAVAGSAGSTCRNQVGNLTPNGSLTHFFAVRLDALLPAAPVTIANTACIDAGPTQAACASATTAAAGAPALHLAKSPAAGSPATADPGATLTYTLSVANTGNQDLAGATLIETVPANTTFLPAAAGAGWQCAPAAGTAGATCTLALGPLAAQAAAVSRSFAVAVADPLPAQPPGALVTNTACAAAAGTDAAGVPQSCSSASTPIAAQPILHTTKTLRSGSGAPGSVLLYDLAVQNTGNEDAAAVTASETVPAHTTFAAAASAAGGTSGWSCMPADGRAGATCTLAAAALAAGTTRHVAFAATVDAPLAAGVTTISNTGCFQLPPALDPPAAQAAPAPPAATTPQAKPTRQAATTPQAKPTRQAATTPQAAPASACDTLTTPAQGRPLLTVAKTYGGPPATPGALLPFQITVTNQGDQDAAGVTLSETVPAHTTFDAGASSAGWSCTPAAGTSGAVCTLAAGALAGAATATTAATAATAATANLGGATGAGAAGGGRSPADGITASSAVAATVAASGGSASATFAVQVDAALPIGVEQIANTACAAATGLAPVCDQVSTPPPGGTPPPPPTAAAPIPTLTSWGLLALAAGCGAAGWRRVRAQPRRVSVRS